MLALLAVPAVMSMVLTSTESSGNASGGKGFTSTLDLPAWAYTVAGAVVFLALLAVTLAFSSTGKRH